MTSRKQRVVCHLFVVFSSLEAHSMAARMFGTGIYSTNVSSSRTFANTLFVAPHSPCLRSPEADIYARAGAFTPFTYSSTKRLKSVILNHVVLGRTELMLAADQSLQHAPGTHNSVSLVFDSRDLCWTADCGVRTGRSQERRLLKAEFCSIMRLLCIGKMRCVRAQ